MHDIDPLLETLPSPGPSSTPCPPIDALTAWRDGRGDTREITQAGKHLLSCRLCRMVLAELGRPITTSRTFPARPASTGHPTRRGWLIAAGLVVAAGLGQIALYESPRATLPDLQLEGPFGGLQTIRSTAAPSHRFGSDSHFGLIVRPAAPMEQRPHVAGWIVQDGRIVNRLPQRVFRIGSTGVVRIEGRAGSLFAGVSGPLTVRLYVGAEAPPSGPPPGSKAARQSTNQRWLSTEIDYQPTRDEEVAP